MRTQTLVPLPCMAGAGLYTFALIPLPGGCALLYFVFTLLLHLLWASSSLCSILHTSFKVFLYPNYATKCNPGLIGGNIHIDDRSGTQAEYAICPRFGWNPPELIVAFVIVMKDPTRGSTRLDARGNLIGNLTLNEHNEHLRTDAIDSFKNKMRERYGDDLVMNLWEISRTHTHHLGGGLKPVSSAGLLCVAYPFSIYLALYALHICRPS